MGSLFSFNKQYVESKTFFPPAPSSYDRSRENLFFVSTKKSRKTACMMYRVNKKKTIVVYSHGNATDIGRMDDFLSGLAREIDVNIISYDYEGYGLTGGKPSEAGCISSINAVYSYLIIKGYAPEDIIFYGTSIGTGPTVNLAARISEGFTKNNRQIKGLLLQSPYTSIIGVVSPSIETTLDMCESVIETPNIFKIYDKIKKVIAPIIIIHGKKDGLIPYDHAVSLCQANKYARLCTLPDGTHDNIESVHYASIKSSLSSLIVGKNG